MNKINLKPDDFHSQTNNELIPYEACKPTSRVMFYKGNGLSPQYPPSKYNQEEDKITSLLRSPEASKWSKKKGFSKVVIEEPNLGNEIYPEYLDPILFNGKIVSGFSYAMPLEEISMRIADGQVLMTSGTFNYYSSLRKTVEQISHAIILAGLWDRGFLIADPYNKDFHTEYRSGKGYLTPMTFDEARSLLKGEESRKWCHYPLPQISGSNP